MNWYNTYNTIYKISSGPPVNMTGTPDQIDKRLRFIIKPYIPILLDKSHTYLDSLEKPGEIEIVDTIKEHDLIDNFQMFDKTKQKNDERSEFCLYFTYGHYRILIVDQNPPNNEDWNNIKSHNVFYFFYAYYNGTIIAKIVYSKGELTPSKNGFDVQQEYCIRGNPSEYKNVSFRHPEITGEL